MLRVIQDIIIILIFVLILLLLSHYRQNELCQVYKFIPDVMFVLHKKQLEPDNFDT